MRSMGKPILQKKKTVDFILLIQMVSKLCYWEKVISIKTQISEKKWTKNCYE